MPKNVSALDARAARQRYRGATSTDRQEYVRIAGDPNLSTKGREVALPPLRAKLTVAHETTRRAIVEIHIAAEEDVAFYAPNEVRRRAAAADTAKTAGAAAIAALEDGAGLLTLARAAVEAKDHATAHGIALGIHRRADLSPEDRAAVMNALDAPHAERARRAVAVLIGVQLEAARHTLEGPLGDAMATLMRDPAAAIAARREAESYTNPASGERIGLNDATVTELLTIAGVAEDIELPPIVAVHTSDSIINDPASAFAGAT
jgi:hypothetical protein